MGWGGFCDRFGEYGMGHMGGLRGGGGMLGIVGPLLGLLFLPGAPCPVCSGDHLAHSADSHHQWRDRGRA